jgi:hypothetical protein
MFQRRLRLIRSLCSKSLSSQRFQETKLATCMPQRSFTQRPPPVDRGCDLFLLQDSSDPYMARASYYERLGRAARKYREGLSKDALDSSQ